MRGLQVIDNYKSFKKKNLYNIIRLPRKLVCCKLLMMYCIVSHVKGAYRDIFEQYQISVERVIDYEKKKVDKKIKMLLI